MKTYNISSPDELGAVASDFISNFGDEKVVAFYGTMGAGKTTFIKALCDVLKVDDVVNSPSFAITNEYSIPSGGVIFHFDFYRLKSVSEAFDMGYEDYFYSGNYCFIEWPEKVADILPSNYLKVMVDITSDNGREITVERV